MQLKSEILSKRTTCPTEMSKRTTSEWNWQNCRGGSTASRRVAPSAAAGGGRACRHQSWRHVAVPWPAVNAAQPAALAGGGTVTWRACRHRRWWHVLLADSPPHADGADFDVDGADSHADCLRFALSVILRLMYPV
jgi:hypothetical protein